MEQSMLDTAPQGEVNHDHNGWLKKLDDQVKMLGNWALACFTLVCFVVIAVFVLTDRSFAVSFAIAASAGSIVGILTFLGGAAVILSDR